MTRIFRATLVLAAVAAIAGAFFIGRAYDSGNNSIATVDPQAQTTVLQGIHQNMEHLRWSAGSYRDQAFIPSDELFLEAETSDTAQYALNEGLKNFDIATTTIESDEGDCVALSFVYNRGAAHLVSSPGGREALAALGLPESYDQQRCRDGKPGDPEVAPTS